MNSPSNDNYAISQISEERSISPRFMRLIGEALTRLISVGEEVIIGWDDRPRNKELVNDLTIGLHLGGAVVCHAGICSTPALHNALLEKNASFGCMITASHNPVTDSGIKIFDCHGYKTNKNIESELSELIIQLASEEREVDEIDEVELSIPDSLFEADSAHQELSVVRLAEFTGLFGTPNLDKIILDCSKGAPSYWLADFLRKQGIEAFEVSQNAPALNHNCGAGELAPTDSWTWLEAARSEHVLINSLQKTESGKIIGAALDGDGDRCLFIESTENGCKVLDGDGMADHILRAVNGQWTLAASIESDLALSSSLERLNADVKFIETAVGDRWLSYSLKDEERNVIGVEDSGHLVLSCPHPHGGRTLVGDGVASLLAVICAISVEERPAEFERGFKRRISINNTNRSLWTGDNELADQIEHIASTIIGGFQRQSIEGEPNLMMMKTEGVSIGIRNSGTQAKTNVSLRCSPGINTQKPLEIVKLIVKALTEALTN